MRPCNHATDAAPNDLKAPVQRDMTAALLAVFVRDPAGNLVVVVNWQLPWRRCLA